MNSTVIEGSMTASLISAWQRGHDMVGTTVAAVLVFVSDGMSHSLLGWQRYASQTPPLLHAILRPRIVGCPFASRRKAKGTTRSFQKGPQLGTGRIRTMVQTN